jgi:hypothetical protein
VPPGDDEPVAGVPFDLVLDPPHPAAAVALTSTRKAAISSLRVDKVIPWISPFQFRARSAIILLTSKTLVTG